MGERFDTDSADRCCAVHRGRRGRYLGDVENRVLDLGVAMATVLDDPRRVATPGSLPDEERYQRARNRFVADTTISTDAKIRSVLAGDRPTVHLCIDDRGYDYDAAELAELLCEQDQEAAPYLCWGEQTPEVVAKKSDIIWNLARDSAEELASTVDVATYGDTE